ncbi:MAG: 2-dehydropantoate 2-reductase [Alphaproteobacteria bacterium]|jgi:2-dehydropantoate 2-reductase|nr:2-dehydropantoate 2-reductase [Alphaproteobacteria bacterium]
MKIAVMGSGGIGGYFGGRLATSGEDVTFIARRAHLEAMQKDGLRIVSPLGDAHIAPVKATDDPGSIGPVDIVMFCVKLYDVEEAAELCKPLIGPDTAVISFLNGVDSEARLQAVLGAEAVVGGVARIPSNISQPGVIEHMAPFAELEFGELDGRDNGRLNTFHEACGRAGIESDLVDNIEVAIWLKLAILSPFASVCTMTRLPGRIMVEDPDVRDVALAAMREVIAVATAKGIPLPADALESRKEMMSGFINAKPSMLHDLEAGKRIELEGLQGAVVRMGGELGVPTPVHQVVYAALKPYLNGPPVE